MTIAPPQASPLRPDSPENLVFLEDKSLFGRGMLTYRDTHPASSTMLNRQQEFITVEQRQRVTGTNRQTKQPYARWKSAQVLIYKVKNGTLQIFSVKSGKTRNMTTSAEKLYLGDSADAKVYDELVALAQRNNLTLPKSIVPPNEKDIQQLLFGLAYPVLAEAQCLSRQFRVIPACFTDLLRTHSTIEDVFQHLTNNPETELREMLRAYLNSRETPLSYDALFALLWHLALSRGILNKQQRIHLIAGHLRMRMEPSDRYQHWYMMPEKHPRHNAQVSPRFPTLKGLRRLRNFLKLARDTRDDSAVFRTFAAVMYEPYAVNHLLDGFKHTELLAYITTAGEAISDAEWSLRQIDVTKQIPLESAEEDVDELVTVMEKLAQSDLLTLTQDGRRVDLSFDRYFPGRGDQPGTIKEEPLLFVSSNFNTFSNKAKVRNVYTYQGLGSPYSKNEGQYARPVLSQTLKLWNQAEELLDEANIPLRLNTITRLFVWLALNNAGKPTKRVLKLASMSLNMAVFLRLTETRQSVAEARVLLEGLPVDLALQFLK